MELIVFKPSPDFAYAGYTFQEVHRERKKRLEQFREKHPAQTREAKLREAELETDLRFYLSAEQEVHQLITRVISLSASLNLCKASLREHERIFRDFAKNHDLELGLIDFTLKQLKERRHA